MGTCSPVARDFASVLYGVVLVLPVLSYLVMVLYGSFFLTLGPPSSRERRRQCIIVEGTKIYVKSMPFFNSHADPALLVSYHTYT